jgi:hypothetical protein
MNSEQQSQAKHLYFQTSLTKTQIAEMLNIPRRTLHYWIKEKNWDRIKKSATHMPSLIAENCYLIMARFSQQILSEDRIMRPITHKEADTLHKLTLTIGKLKNRSTLNESMEMFGVFMDNVSKKAPDLAEEITPFVDEYISSRAAINVHQFKPDNMNDNGLYPIEKENTRELQLDLQDIMEWDMAANNTPTANIEQLRFTDEQTQNAGPLPEDEPDMRDSRVTPPDPQPAMSDNRSATPPSPIGEGRGEVYTPEEIQYHLKEARELLKNRALRQSLNTVEEFNTPQQQESELQTSIPQNNQTSVKEAA